MKPLIQITLMSFGYKYGMPIHADMVLDVRFLINPFFVNNLKNKTGHSRVVQSYVLKQAACQKFIRQIAALITFLNREYKKGKRQRFRGKCPKGQRPERSTLTIAFGCTGGRHRSVVVVETLRKILMEKKIPVEICHRDEKKTLLR